MYEDASGVVEDEDEHASEDDCPEGGDASRAGEDDRTEGDLLATMLDLEANLYIDEAEISVQRGDHEVSHTVVSCNRNEYGNQMLLPDCQIVRAVLRIRLRSQTLRLRRCSGHCFKCSCNCDW